MEAFGGFRWSENCLHFNMILYTTRRLESDNFIFSSYRCYGCYYISIMYIHFRWNSSKSKIGDKKLMWSIMLIGSLFIEMFAKQFPSISIQISPFLFMTMMSIKETSSDVSYADFFLHSSIIYLRIHFLRQTLIIVIVDMALG